MLSSSPPTQTIDIEGLCLASAAAKLLPRVQRALRNTDERGSACFGGQLTATDFQTFLVHWTPEGSTSFHEGGTACRSTARMCDDLGCPRGAHGMALARQQLHPEKLLTLITQLLGASAMRDSEVRKAVEGGADKRVATLQGMLLRAQGMLAKLKKP